MSRTNRKKKSSAGKNIAVFFIVFVILEALIIFGVRYVFKTENSTPQLGGYSFFIMDSDNMDKDIPRDALVIAENGTPSTDKRGYAVVAKNVGDEGTTVAWLYDIGSKGDTVDGVVYTVYQESAPDKMYDLEGSDIIGVTASYYMTAGRIIAFLNTPFGLAASLAAPIVLLIILELIISIANRSKYDDYDEDEEESLEEEVRRRRAAKEAASLDDFLYGGQDDEVYTSEKPKDSYEEEFEDKYAPIANRGQQYEAPANIPVSAPVPEPAPAPVNIQPEPVPVSEFTAEIQPVPAAPAEAIEAAPEVQAAAETQTAAEQPADNAVDRSYYERASEMIDNAVSKDKTESVEAPAPKAAEAPVEKPAPAANRQRRPEGQRRPRPAGQRPAGSRPAPRRRPASARPIPQHKDANAALEELMKMMEQEQQKLRETTAENDKK